MAVICQLLSLYQFVLLIRVVLSWVPIQQDGIIGQIYAFLFRITEPLLAFVRSVLPPMGGFDFSPLLVFLALSVLQRMLCT